MAGIRHMQVTLGLPEPKEFSSLPWLRLVQEGIKQTHAQRVVGKDRICLPITPAILERLRTLWMGVRTSDNITLWAAASLCFFGFFRSGEITVPSIRGFNPAHHLAWGDVSADNKVKSTMLQIHLKKSKTDQLGRGMDVYVGRTGCPVEAILAYIAVRGDSSGPFFKLGDQTPLTKAKFIARVRQALLALGLPYNNFAGHSFRIGAATTAAERGLEDSVITKLGRWSSAAFLSHIRTPSKELGKHAHRLGSYSQSRIDT